MTGSRPGTVQRVVLSLIEAAVPPITRQALHP